jgi:hypothetical protein
MAKLLLIEGLPGTGKSSLAAMLAAEFSNRNLEHRLILESSEINPLRFKEGTSAETEIGEFLTSVQEQWRDFVKAALQDETTIILEGMVFQQQINYLTWINRLQNIHPIVEEIFKAIAPLSSRLIYLRNQDPEKAMTDLMSIRGELWVQEKIRPVSNSPYAEARRLVFPEALNSLILDLQATTDSLFHVAPFVKTEIDVTNRDWGNINQKALAFALV